MLNAWNPKLSKAEPIKAKPSRTSSSVVKRSQAKPGRAKQWKAKPSKAEPRKAKHNKAKTKTSQAQQSQAKQRKQSQAQQCNPTEPSNKTEGSERVLQVIIYFTWCASTAKLSPNGFIDFGSRPLICEIHACCFVTKLDPSCIPCIAFR